MQDIIVVLIVFSTILGIFVLPLWIIFNYLGKAKTAGAMSKEDEQMLEDLWKMSKTMEQRVENLEAILEEGKGK